MLAGDWFDRWKMTFEGMFSGSKFAEWWASLAVFPNEAVCKKCQRFNMGHPQVAQGLSGPDKELSERIKKAACICNP